MVKITEISSKYKYKPMVSSKYINGFKSNTSGIISGKNKGVSDDRKTEQIYYFLNNEDYEKSKEERKKFYQIYPVDCLCCAGTGCSYCN